MINDKDKPESKSEIDFRMSWKKPVEVMGYNNAVHFFGSVFEAETNCISAHNMGQVIELKAREDRQL